MLLSLQVIRAALAAGGIHRPAVTFDADGRKIVVNFTRAGKPERKEIPFDEIEQAFTQAPQAAGAGRAAERPPRRSKTG